ncbi:MAG: NAD(P)H-hydrate epimerase, partial [Nitrospirae bacterium]
MLPVVTADKMREIDRVTIETLGMPSLVLMERAGLAVVKRILEWGERPERFVVFSGGGNNGGDGIVIARELHNRGYSVKLYLLSPPERLSPDCKKEFDIAREYRLPISTSPPRSARSLEGCIIVDAIIGTGLNKPLKDKIDQVVNLINRSGSPVFSVDIPTGISSDTGEVMGSAVMADVTVTFGLPKRGHLLPPGNEYTGSLFIEDIGFPSFLTGGADHNTLLLKKEDAVELIPYRTKDSYKGTYGHLLVLGGSRGKTGALMLSGRAALRTGSGLVTLSSDAETIQSIAPSILEEMTLPL